MARMTVAAAVPHRKAPLLLLKRTRRAILLAASMVLGVLLAGGAALALPSETPDDTPMVNGNVRSFAQVGDNLWLGGNFTQVKNASGTVIDNVSNVAVFDLTTGAYKPGIAPQLSGTGAKVTEIKVYGDDVVIGGTFAGPTTSKKNLAVYDGTTGELVRWYNAAPLESVLPAPDLGRIYGGGKSLAAFDASGADNFAKLWTRAATTVDDTLRSHVLTPGYRDLELDPDGSTIWAACGCDEVAGSPAKVIVKLDIEGNHDPSWVGEGGIEAFGISLTQVGGELYLAAGGSDYFAAYPKAGSGERRWSRDTSGSAQVVELMDGKLVVGGHFWEVADQAGDQCGGRGPTPDNPKLDPSPGGECETRHGLAAYSLEGVLDGGGTPENIEDGWNPMLEGKYNLAWALHPEVGAQGSRLHVGGEFLTVNGNKQNYYARLSNAQPPATCTINGTSAGETLTGTTGDDVICAGGGNDILRGLEGNDTLRGESGADKLYGDAGDDTLDGGSSTDTAYFSGSPASVAASLATSTATGEGSDTFVDVENLTGSSIDDNLTGSDGNNVLNGGDGADSIVGLGGADKLLGANGNDTLDSLDGVAGNDTLNGGANSDTCITDATENSIVKCEL